MHNMPAAPINGTPWHQLEPSAVLTQFCSDAAGGLTEAEAQRRLAEQGPNELQAVARVAPLHLLMAQFKNVLIVILLVAVILSLFLGHTVEAIAIAIIVLFAVLLGFVQEYRAERAMEALRRMAAPAATVVRDGEERSLAARQLVPGDIVLLHTGDGIPADTRLLEAFNLKIEEASPTGESLPVEKHMAALGAVDVAVGDRRNMAFAGTAATYGRRRAVVVATGMQTEFGKIARLRQTVESGKTPLQQNLDRVGHALARAAIVVVLLIVGLGLWRGQPRAFGVRRHALRRVVQRRHQRARHGE